MKHWYYYSNFCLLYLKTKGCDFLVCSQKQYHTRIWDLKKSKIVKYHFLSPEKLCFEQFIVKLAQHPKKSLLISHSLFVMCILMEECGDYFEIVEIGLYEFTLFSIEIICCKLVLIVCEILDNLLSSMFSCLDLKNQKKKVTPLFFLLYSFSYHSINVMKS